MDALGGTMVNDSRAAPTANFDNADGMAILQALHTLRFTDNAMSATQGLAWGTLQQQFAAGKLGMYIAAPDDIYNVIVPTDKGNVNDIGMGPLPSVTGTPAGSLSGGNDYMFAKHDTPAQIEAGIKWIDFEDLTPGDGQFNFARKKADGLPVGFPEPELFDGATGAQINQLRAKYATINTSYYTPFVNAQEAGDGEPTRRPGRLQDAGPGHAGRADRAERQHPGAAEDGRGQRQHHPGEQRGVMRKPLRSDDSLISRHGRARGGRRPQPPAPRPAAQCRRMTGEANGGRCHRRREARGRAPGGRARAAAAGAAAEGAAQLSAAGFLIGAVLCFTFFSWYPIVREVIMSFQKAVYGRRLRLGGLVQLHPDLPRPDVLAGLAQHAGVHRAGPGRRLRGRRSSSRCC